MSPEELERVMDNPDFIPGIYNYCDRWCERCPMTARCATFAIEQLQNENREDVEESVTEDSTIDALGKLDELFRMTIRMIQQTAEEMGMDLKMEVTESDFEEDLGGNTSSLYLLPEAKEYANEASKWFEHASEVELWPFLEKEWQDSINLNLPNRSPVLDAEQTRDAFEIINWYQYQIQVKLQRAIRALRKVKKQDRGAEFERSDANGSAKVALIGLDRSIDAWAHFLKIIPEEQDTLLPILALLAKIRRKTEKLFPEARSFQRPGLDL